MVNLLKILSLFVVAMHLQITAFSQPISSKQAVSGCARFVTSVIYGGPLSLRSDIRMHLNGYDLLKGERNDGLKAELVNRLQDIYGQLDHKAARWSFQATLLPKSEGEKVSPQLRAIYATILTEKWSRAVAADWAKIFLKQHQSQIHRILQFAKERILRSKDPEVVRAYNEIVAPGILLQSASPYRVFVAKNGAIAPTLFPFSGGSEYLLKESSFSGFISWIFNARDGLPTTPEQEATLNWLAYEFFDKLRESTESENEGYVRYRVRPYERDENSSFSSSNPSADIQKEWRDQLFGILRDLFPGNARLLGPDAIDPEEELVRMILDPRQSDVTMDTFHKYIATVLSSKAMLDPHKLRPKTRRAWEPAESEREFVFRQNRDRLNETMLENAKALMFRMPPVNHGFAQTYEFTVIADSAGRILYVGPNAQGLQKSGDQFASKIWIGLHKKAPRFDYDIEALHPQVSIDKRKSNEAVNAVVRFTNQLTHYRNFTLSIKADPLTE